MDIFFRKILRIDQEDKFYFYGRLYYKYSVATHYFYGRLYYKYSVATHYCKKFNGWIDSIFWLKYSLFIFLLNGPLKQILVS